MGNVVARDGRSELIRPEAVSVEAAVDGGNATVAGATRHGATTVLRVRLDTGPELDAVTLALSPG